MDKRAVDQVTEDYYTEYFGEYGKAWVRKIPRKVASRIAADTKTSAEDAVIAPLGFTATAGGGLVFEGLFRSVPVIKGRAAAEPHFVFQGFRAEFDAHGELHELTQIAI